MEDVETEWKVTWFPDDVAQRAQRADNEAAAKRLADKHREFHPIVECRTVTVSPWRMVDL